MVIRVSDTSNHSISGFSCWKRFSPSFSGMRRQHCTSRMLQPWKQSYDIMIRLYNRSIKVECACGRYDRVKLLCKTVFEQMARQAEDKPVSYVTRLHFNRMESWKILWCTYGCSHVYGGKVPAKSVRLSLLSSWKKVLRDISGVDILSIPALLDQNSKWNCLG